MGEVSGGSGKTLHEEGACGLLPSGLGGPVSACEHVHACEHTVHMHVNISKHMYTCDHRTHIHTCAYARECVSPEGTDVYPSVIVNMLWIYLCE